jgi:hypothetical protein
MQRLAQSTLLQVIGLLTLYSVIAGTASANAIDGDGVTFIEFATFAVGFDPDDNDFPSTVDYVIPTNAQRLGAQSIDTSPSVSVPVTFKLESCLLLEASTGCEGSIDEDEAYSVEVTLTLMSAVDAPSTGFLLYLSGLNDNVPEGGTAPPPPVYDVDDVRIRLDAPGMDALSVFTWTSSGDDPTTLHYLGWTFDSFEPGTTQSLKFRYDVSSQLAGGTPVFRTNAAYEFVPEPSTALLVGLGLACLASRRNGSGGR